MQLEVQKIPINLPDIEEDLKSIIDSIDQISLRIEIVKEAAGREKINFQKLEHLIHDYNNCTAKLPKGEQLIEGLESSKQAIASAKKVVQEEDPSIEALNAMSNRLDSVPVNLGIEETEIRC